MFCRFCRKLRPFSGDEEVMCDQISMEKGWWAGGSRLRASSLFNAIWPPFRFLLLWIAGLRYDMAKV